MQAYSSGDVAADTGAAIAVVVMVLLYLALIVFGFSLYWRIVGKAGWPGWYSLGLLVPLLNLALVVMFAFKEWPVEAENRMLRAHLGYGGYGGAWVGPATGGFGGTWAGPATGGFGGPPPGPVRVTDHPTTAPGYPSGRPAQPWSGPTG